MKPLQPTGPLRLGRYRLESKLGEGGMGQVYLARTAGGRRVVVKVIRPELTGDPDFRARFAKEAEMAREVGGFHTAQVVDADPEGDPPWIATAFIPGPSLEQAVRENGPFDEPELTALALGLAEGLEAIHGCGLVHRDLKPANILLAEDGPRIIDFGIARPVDATEMTRTGTVLGTLTYMSPEQAKSEPVSPASDMFTLGTVLAFAATGTNPFTADTMGAIVFKVISKAPEVEGLPDRFQRLIAACWDHDPKQRPAPADVIAALGDIGTGVRSSDEAGLPTEQATDEYPTPMLAPTKRESELPGSDIQDSSGPESPSGTRPSVLRRRPLITAMGAVLITGLIYWNVPSSAKEPSPPEVEADLVVDLHGGLHEEDDEPDTTVTSMTVSPNGSILVTQDDFSLKQGWPSKRFNRTYVRLWDTATGEKLAERRFGEDSPPWKVLFGPDGTPLLTQFTPEGEALLQDLATKETLLTFSPKQGSIRTLRFSADNSAILTRTSTNKVLEWDAVTGEYLSSHDVEENAKPKRVTSPSQKITTDQKSGRVDLLVADSDELIATIGGEGEEIHSHTFSPDGTILATGGSNEKAQLWEAESGDLISTYTTYEDNFYTRNFISSVEIEALTFSPDGSTLATGRSDGEIHLWDIESGEQTLTLIGHEEKVEHVVFGADGDTLFAGGPGNMIRMWKFA